MQQAAFLLLLLVGAFAISIPFGMWRARTKKFSPAWFLAIHLPVPFLFLARTALGLSILVVPLAIAASVAGQIVGARMRGDAHPNDELADEAALECANVDHSTGQTSMLDDEKCLVNPHSGAVRD